MSSDLSLWCYYWEHGNLSPFEIKVPPNATVDNCMRRILQRRKSDSPIGCTRLYKIPQNHPVPLHDIESTLGALSVSDLGSHLHIHELMQDIFQPHPEEGHLHLVLVDRGAPLPIDIWIPSVQVRLPVEVKENDAPDSLLPRVKERDPRLEREVKFAFYKTPYNKSQLHELNSMAKDRRLPGFDMLFYAFDDVAVSKRLCVTVEVDHRERKHLLSWDPAERATKKRQFLDVPPSSVDHHHYLKVQGISSERLFDFRGPFNYTAELPEGALPPIEVLFDGFGKFLDIFRAASMSSFKPHSPTLDTHVEEFVNSMSGIYSIEGGRQSRGLESLNVIFPPTVKRDPIAPGAVPRMSIAGSVPGAGPRTSTTGLVSYTDGHSLYGRRGIPCIIVKFKNESGGGAIPIAELVSYYARIVRGIDETVIRGSILPALGITIVGPSITFFALAFVGSPVYVPLTPSLWCLPVECGGSDRHLIYTAFRAASTLLENIETEAERLSHGSPTRIDKHFVPFNRLTRYPSFPSPPTGDNDSSQWVEFQITGFVEKSIHQHVYTASSSCGDLVIKLTRSYSAGFHAFCADHGFAPKLYGYQELPGGFIAVATEHVKGKTLDTAEIPEEHREKYVNHLRKSVACMHGEGYVHGDLRPPNIMCVEDQTMLLDFDWGEKAGKAQYPHTRLHPQLKEGRDMSCLKITKEDDERVLGRTVEYLLGRR